MLLYRSTGWREPHQALPPSAVPNPLFSWRLRSAVNNGVYLPESEIPSPIRPGRRPNASRNPNNYPGSVQQRQRLDTTMFYPEMSPYEEQSRSQSAPVRRDHPYRPISRPEPTSYYHEYYQPYRPVTTAATRPTPQTRSTGARRYNRTPAGDAIFSNDNEFHLFVQATSGFGPEQPPRASASSTGCVPRRWSDNEADDVRHMSVAGDIISPSLETPTSLLALQHLAQMLGDPRLPPQEASGLERARARNRSSSSYTQQVWLNPPFHPQSDSGDSTPSDDGLPDYAHSQAEAAAIQRAEAARRAQELRRRWEQSR